MTTQFEGTMGQAWVFDVPRTTKAHEAAIMSWIIHAPHAHPLWSHYLMSLIHLRPIPGAEDALKYHPDATHEIIVFAVDPASEIVNGVAPSLLQPANFMEQFRAPDDAAALEAVESVIKEIVNGDLSPDTDWRSEWTRRFPYPNPGVKL